MSTLPPRAVIVRRETAYEALLRQHGTHNQAAFVLRSFEQDIDEVLARHQANKSAQETLSAAIPLAWRRAAVERSALDSFLFEPEDVIVVVGQDGLVANVAKYVEAQPVIGVNPDPCLYDGILVPHSAQRGVELLLDVAKGKCHFMNRKMVQVETARGQTLSALNELFLGHQSHQSARYLLGYRQEKERQSSSGIIVSTGTGATGWASSIYRARGLSSALPSPEDAKLMFFVREAFASVRTGTDFTFGDITSDEFLYFRSEMKTGGVVFGDGIESDAIELPFGMEVRVRIADRVLRCAQ
jgi:hypothetical protein